jgi:hypothetical protein
MSHHHYDGEIPMTEEKTSRHRHSHHHINLKPAAVIDHFKTKVKRIRSTKDDQSELSISSLSQNKNTNNNNKQLDQEHIESIHKIPTTSSDKHSTVENNEHSKLSIFNKLIEKDEQDAVVPNGINYDEEIEEHSQWQTNNITSETNQKMPRSKQISLKTSKSLLETSNQSNAKKRRQTFRRTVQFCYQKNQIYFI